MPQREPALLWLRDFALTALVLALCTLTSWVFFRLDFVSSNYILTYILGVMYINVFIHISEPTRPLSISYAVSCLII